MTTTPAPTLASPATGGCPPWCQSTDEEPADLDAVDTSGPKRTGRVHRRQVSELWAIEQTSEIGPDGAAGLLPPEPGRLLTTSHGGSWVHLSLADRRELASNVEALIEQATA